MKKYVLAGASSRGLSMYAMPIYENFKDCAVLTGVFDVNPGRAKYVSEKCGNVNVYDDFDRMVETEKPDCVIITTVDAYHSDYIIRSLELGCDVICEKPMTIDAERCRAVLDAEEKYGKKVVITFNYRYGPFPTRIKELITEGAIGAPYSVQFEWLLERVQKLSGHGASYYRRWNSRMQKSGGLLVHKSTHHFDLINWWLDARPQKVAAFGALNLYGVKNSGFSGVNCRRCEHTAQCPFYYQLDEFEKEFYAANESYDNYYKDRCVFSDEVNIYDTMTVNVRYDKGQLLSYALNSTTPYEGWKASINGSKGRLEAFLPETGVQSVEAPYNTIKVFDLDNNITEYKISKDSGGHGGGDERLLETLFRGSAPDPLGHAAGVKAGADSIMIGVAANTSIREQRLVDIDDLLQRAR